MILQTKTANQRAVCFTPERGTVLNTLQECRSPVKISNFRTSNKYSGTDIIIDKQTQVTSLDINKFNTFAYGDEMENVDIKSVLEATPEQLVSLKAKVKTISAPKVISTTSGTLKKQECTTVDPTNYIQLVLWEENVERLQENVTCVFKNLRVKKSSFGKYLNTAKGTEFTFKEVENFTLPLAQVDDDVPTLTIQETNGSIVGVQQLDKHLTCIKCSKKVE